MARLAGAAGGEPQREASMVELFGRSWSRTELAARAGGLAQVAGVELNQLADGPERGVRVLAFRTGSGLSFEAAVDRGFDLLAAEYRASRSAGARRQDRATRRSPRSRTAAAGVSCARSRACSRPAASIMRSRLRPRAPPATSTGASPRPTIRCTAGSPRSRPACSAMASAGTATPAPSMPRARSRRWPSSARTWC